MIDLSYSNKDGLNPAKGFTEVFDYHKDGNPDGDGYEHGGYPEITGQTSPYTDTSFRTGDDPDFFHNGNVIEQPEVKTAELVSIEITSAPTKIEYNEGEALDLSGLAITGHYDDDTEKVISGYVATPANGTILTNETEVEISYKGFTVAQTIIVIPAVILEGIEITSAPAKTSYFIGDALDLTGMVVVGHYSDGTSEEVDYTATPADGTILTDETQVVVEFGGFTATQAITVSAITEGAKINDTYYDNMADALVALAEIDVPATVIPYEDITLGASSLNIAEGQDITLDLNGHKVVSTKTGATTATIYNAGTLRIIDNATGGEVVGSKRCVASTGTTIIDGGSYTSDDCALCVDEGGSIEINNADVTAQEFGVLVTKASHLTINDGTFTTIDNAVVGTNGTAGWGGSDIVINGGTFNGHITSAGYVACGVYLANDDDLTVNGGTFDIENGCGILVRSGEATVGSDTIINVSGDIVGKVGDSRVVVPCKELVVDYAAHYPGGEPVLTNNTGYEPYIVETLDRIEITTAPAKTSYFVGDILDLSGLVVTAYYDYGRSRVVDPVASPANGTVLEAGVTGVELTYGGKTVVQPITVADVVLENIEITTAPAKVDYVAGQILNLEGMVVTAHYNSGAAVEVNDYTSVPENGAVLVDEAEVVVSYGGKSAVQAITVVPVALDSIVVSTPPTVIDYHEGDALDLTGMVVTAVYNNGTTENVIGYTTDPENGAILTNETAVVITYEGKTTTQLIHVGSNLLSIELTTDPEKMFYWVGDPLDLSGMVVTAHYNDGSEKDVTADVTSDPAEGTILTEADDEKNVTIYYTEGDITKTLEYDIVVVEK